MSLGHVIWPGGTAGRPHSSAASWRTVARFLIGNPAGSTSRTCRLGGLAESMKVIRVSAGTARHSAACFGGAPTITPPGFTPLTDGCGVAAAPTAGARDAGPPDAAVPAPATVVPQAARPIMSPAAMPPSAARPAAPRGLPSVLIVTPFWTGALRAAPRLSSATAPAGQIRGAGWPPGAGPAVSGRARGRGVSPAPAIRVLVRAGLAAPGPPAHSSTGQRTGWFRPARIPRLARLRAGGHRAGRVGHPVGPGAHVERRGDARQLQRQHLVGGGDTGAAVDAHQPGA